ncbi:hypothetical protein GPL21_40755 [Bradyrhizobium pachyrhizi]|uniref:Uncharacterized protein n=1 Tax=Bradyrhizobium pachyrhizi TaxID=280333 RepID=A0A844SZ96_9BRAD|nr:hypothetical protein [Bradyrhizobium pachyrhizi]
MVLVASHLTTKEIDGLGLGDSLVARPARRWPFRCRPARQGWRGHGHAFIDRAALYLPKECTDDSARPKAAHVPSDSANRESEERPASSRPAHPGNARFAKMV